jgi:2-C-methyl-D-erythritol 2,4-cyclodiphosphate synthase
MRVRVAELLCIELDQVSIKAKTPEGLGLDHVAQAHAVVLLERVRDPEDLKSMSAVVQSQRELEDIVEDLLTQVHGVPKRKEIVPAFDTEDIT